MYRSNLHPLTKNYEIEMTKVSVDLLRVGHVFPPKAAERRAEDFKAEQKHTRALKLAKEKQRKQLREQQDRRIRGLRSHSSHVEDVDTFTMADAIAILQDEVAVEAVLDAIEQEIQDSP